jgi:hypothetical protein
MDKTLTNKKKKKKVEESSCVAPGLLETESKLGFEALAGALIQRSSSDSDQARRELDQSMSAKGGKEDEPVKGGEQASCKEGKLINAKCYLECPAGYKGEDENRLCHQDCEQTGTHKFSGVLLFFPVCGMDPDAITTSWTEIMIRGAQVIMTAIDLGKDIKDEGFKPENIKDIVDMVIEMAKPLAKPVCNLTAGGLLAREAHTAHEYEGAMKVFQHFDSNFDGNIDEAELSKKQKIFGRQVAIDDGLMAEIDSNHDSLLQFNEFVDWLRKKRVFEGPARIHRDEV